MEQSALFAFLMESNQIEGIKQEPTQIQIENSELILSLSTLELSALCLAQSTFAPRKPLRDKPGMNVRVGSHIAPAGGPDITEKLESILLVAHIPDTCPWMIHCAFESLHPFMDGNGRTGRLLWAWQMLRNGQDPFALSFLHRFYYQTLSSVRVALPAPPQEDKSND